MNETTGHPKKRKVFLASGKNPEQQQKAFEKLHEAFDTTPRTAEEAEFIVVDLEDPVLPRDWGNAANILLVVPGHRYPPIILAEGGKEDPNFRIVLDGIVSQADKLPRCKTQDDLLALLSRIETLLPFYNQKNAPPQPLNAYPGSEELLSLVLASIRVRDSARAQ